MHGTHYWNEERQANERAGQDIGPRLRELQERGIVFIDDDTHIGSSHPDFYHSTFHAPWYIFEHWNSFFDVTGLLPGGSSGQDLVILRRRADDEVVRRRSVMPVPLRTPPPRRTESAAGCTEVRDQIGRAVGVWPPARTTAGRAKRRALRYERERQDQVNALLATALDETRSQLAALEARMAPSNARSVIVLSQSMDTQGERLTALARELRERFDRLEAEQ